MLCCNHAPTPSLTQTCGAIKLPHTTSSHRWCRSSLAAAGGWAQGPWLPPRRHPSSARPRLRAGEGVHQAAAVKGEGAPGRATMFCRTTAGGETGRNVMVVPWTHSPGASHEGSYTPKHAERERERERVGEAPLTHKAAASTKVQAALALHQGLRLLLHVLAHHDGRVPHWVR